MSYTPKNPNGQATMANSGPVVIASDQSAIPTSASSLPLPTGAATSINQTNGTQQTKVSDGTNSVGVLKADGTVASTQNAQIVSGTGMTAATLTLNAGSPNTVWFDMLNYAWLSIKILTNTTPATLTFQTAGDSAGTNPSSVNLLSPNSAATASTSTSASATFHGPRTDRFFRVSSNVAGGNTVTMTITFYTNPSALQSETVSQGGTWTIGSNSATASAVPSNAFYTGISDGTNLRGIVGAANALNSTGTGIPTAQIVAQFDDTSPTSITENQFGNVRMSTNRNLYGTIRDAAGNERGVNVTAGNALQGDVTSLAGTAVSTGVGATGAGVQRVVQANGSGRTLLSAGGSASASGNNTLITAGTNKLKVYAFSLTTTSTTAMTCIFQSGASGTELWRVIIQAPTGANAGANLSVAVPAYLFSTASATLLNLNLSSANAVHWALSYFDEA